MLCCQVIAADALPECASPARLHRCTTGGTLRDVPTSTALPAPISCAGFTPLHFACKFGQREAARWLLENGALSSLEARAEGQVTPLIHAAEEKQFHMIPPLLEAGADPAAMDTAHWQVGGEEEAGSARWWRPSMPATSVNWLESIRSTRGLAGMLWHDMQSCFIGQHGGKAWTIHSVLVCSSVRLEPPVHGS